MKKFTLDTYVYIFALSPLRPITLASRFSFTLILIKDPPPNQFCCFIFMAMRTCFNAVKDDKQFI